MRILSSRFKDPCDYIESVWVVRENIPGFILYMCMCVWCACVFAYVWGVQTHMCVEARGWWKVYIFSIALYIICWGRISHLNSELASWTSQASQAILQFSPNLKNLNFVDVRKQVILVFLSQAFCAWCDNLKFILQVTQFPSFSEIKLCCLYIQHFLLSTDGIHIGFISWLFVNSAQETWMHIYLGDMLGFLWVYIWEYYS